MIVSTPYTEVYVKRSFLSGSPEYGRDETIFGVLVGIRFVSNRAPLYLVWLPSMGALYDKVDQCAIFIREETPDYPVTMSDVGWWDCISNYWQLTQLRVLEACPVVMLSRTGRELKGDYLWTCDPQADPERVSFGQSRTWHEHKTKNYFFDKETGVLCCGPNNKMRFVSSSLSPSNLEDPRWLKVYQDTDDNKRQTHEEFGFFGESESWDYTQKAKLPKKS